MATFLDAVGTLEEFSVIFIFILIFIVLYGLLQYTKMIGENKAIHAIISLAVSIIFLFSQTASKIIETIIIINIVFWLNVYFHFTIAFRIITAFYGLTFNISKSL